MVFEIQSKRPVRIAREMNDVFILLILQSKF
jgi:hypothetical protein